MSRFERAFMELLREDAPVTYRTDGAGKRFKMPCGSPYRQGKNKRGAIIKPGHTAREDETGQMHSVLAPCERLKAGANKKAIPVCPGDSTTEKNGQIMKRPKKLRKESSKISFDELYDRMIYLRNG